MTGTVICPCCDRELPDRATIGGLLIELNPPSVYWRGVRHHRQPAEIKTLYLLAKRRKVSHLALEMMTLREDTTSAAAKVRISVLRAWLRKIGANISIRSERGWGYVMEEARAEA